MTFTNVFYDTKNSRVHLWEKENGKRKHNIIDWVPYVFIPNPQEESNIKTIQGMPVSKKEFDTYKDYTNFQENQMAYENHCVPSIQFLADRYHYWNSDDMEIPDLDIYAIDIEVHKDPSSGKGFPKPQDAEHPITAISVDSILDDKTITFGLHPYTPKSDKVEYYHCPSEEKLLSTFFDWWYKNFPDVITGWNIAPSTKSNRYGGFDIPYLINRTKNLFGEKTKEYLKFSPIKKVNIYSQKETNAIFVTIGGVSILDYLSLYKWYSGKNPSNYKLDTILEIEGIEQKLDYGNIPLGDLYYQDWEMYIDYNIWDSKAINQLERKLGYIALSQALSILCKCPMEKYNATTQLVEGLLLTYYRQNNLCAPYFAGGQQESFPAAYVKEPQKGLHGWNVDLDISSSYPSAIITLKMSMENYYGKIKGINEDRLMEYVKNNKIEEPFYFEKPEQPNRYQVSTVGKTKDSIWIEGKELEKFNKLIQRKLISIAPCGSCFRNDINGVFSNMEHDVYNKRQEKKKEMKSINKQIENMEDCEEKENLKIQSSKLDSTQKAMKTIINGAYGACSVPYSRYFLVPLAEAIPSCGRYTIKKGEEFVNDFFNSGKWCENQEITELFNSISKDWEYKELKKDIVILIDTDSCSEDSVIDVDGKKITVKDYFNYLPEKYQYYDDFNDYYIKKGSGETPTVNKDLQMRYNPIQYVMCHKVKKKMYKIDVEGDEVIVTEDHSVMVYRNSVLISVKPYEIKEDDYIVKIKE